MVGARGFEPPATWPPAKCATRLRYAPNYKMLSTMGCCCCQQEGNAGEFFPTSCPHHLIRRSSLEAQI